MITPLPPAPQITHDIAPYENPGADVVDIDGDGDLDFTGEIVHTETLITNTTSVELTSLNTGVYVFNIISANKSLIKR